MIGVVSLFADISYEGARSITGPFVAFLGASAFVTGVVAGVGEFVGYALRIVFGYLSERTGRYWPITLWGYGLTFVVVPLLALAGSRQAAAALIVSERLREAIRTPVRNTILAHAYRPGLIRVVRKTPLTTSCSPRWSCLYIAAPAGLR